mmetsp:Transcript_23198/g.64415  ORF Transcript_23198/g.64415 Transcript_23198/m.64415 type:complete len:285 (-) Transcript_23198:617-1471(-)
MLGARTPNRAGLSPSAPLLRSNLLAFLATVDAVVIVTLVLFSIQGNLWASLFPHDWPARPALATSMGDMLLLLGLRWTLTTSTGSGAGCMLSQAGLVLSAVIHSSATMYLIVKTAAAAKSASELSTPELATILMADLFSIAAIWVQYLLSLSSVNLLREQLWWDQVVPGSAYSIRVAGGSGIAQPLLDITDMEARGSSAYRQSGSLHARQALWRPEGSAVPFPEQAAVTTNGDEEDAFDDAHSDCSFHSAQTATSFASAATHATSASATTSSHTGVRMGSSTWR